MTGLARSNGSLSEWLSGTKAHDQRKPDIQSGILLQLAKQTEAMMQVELLLLEEDDWVPNNSLLPVVIYRNAAPALECEPLATLWEKRFLSHGWPPRWRDTVFDFHHYHSTAHEVLGVAAGSANLILGGPRGQIVAVSAGDALALPVGIGHCRQWASETFLVVGAYPEGQDWDICRDAPSALARSRMQELFVPDKDPIEGARGVISRHWPRPKTTA